MTIVVDTLFFFVLLVLLPPLMLGVIRKTKARLQNRIGAPLWQPILDLLKLFGKDETVSETASWVFRFSAAAGLSMALYLAFITPWIKPQPHFATCDLFFLLYMFAAMRFFTLLAAMDTASAFGAFAASREATLSCLVEPAAILSLASLGVVAQASDLNVVFSQLAGKHAALWIASGTAFFLASLVELSRMPIDDPTTHLELTMVHEAMILEASGKNLALIEYATAIKLCILLGLSAQCYLHTFPNIASLSAPVLVGASLAGLTSMAVIVGVFESLAVKLNWRKAPEFIAYALTLSFMASLIAIGSELL